MKTYNYLWMMVCTFFCQIVCSQSVQNNRADPSVQLKQLLQLPLVGLPLLKMPAIISKPKMPAIIAFDIAKNMTEAKQLCPFLKFIPALQLEGERNSNENVGLQWETTNGFDTRAFDVYRSLGDTIHFEKINFVWANERISIKDKYHLPDNNDYNEVSYYRLKLLLNDGKFVYSNIVAVNGYDKFLFALYPNPAAHKLKINLSTKEGGSASITVYDASGKMVLRESSFLIKGYELREIDVTKLSGGLYTVKMILPDKQIRIGKFLKN
ncbi:MAG: T9SS type A sorting domain-containing protein [Chitinophagaceae bacterium]